MFRESYVLLLARVAGGDSQARACTLAVNGVNRSNGHVKFEGDVSVICGVNHGLCELRQGPMVGQALR